MIDLIIGVVGHVTKEMLAQTIENMKQQISCCEIDYGIRETLSYARIVNTTKVTYVNIWLVLEVETTI